MRLLVRTAILLAAAGGFVVTLSLTSSADVVEPSSAYQPASTKLIAEDNPDDGTSLPSEQIGGAASAMGVPPQPAETRVEVAPATPAPELHVIRPVNAQPAQVEPVTQDSALAKAVRPLGVGLERIGSYLGRVVSACQVAAGSGAGVPVLALAVLSVAAAFDRRRVLGIWSATDEDVPELLYATEVIAPG